MGAATAHLSNVKDVKIIDFGGQGKGSSVGKFGSAPLEILTKFAEGATGTGFDVSKLFNFLGIDPKDLATASDKKDDTFAPVDEKKTTTKKEDPKA